MKTLFSDFAQEDGPPVTCSNDTGDISVVWDFDDLRPSASHSMTKNLAASTEFGQTAFTDKPKTHIGGVFLFENDTLHDLCEKQLPEKKRKEREKEKERKTERKCSNLGHLYVASSKF